MKGNHVLVSYRTSGEEREAIKTILNGHAEITFLDDHQPEEHPGLFRSSDAVICWRPAKEIKNSSPGDLSNLKFIQLLSAGYDNIDFNMFPPGCKIAANQGAYAEPMAEHIMAMLLALSKRLLVNHNDMAKGGFKTSEPTKELKNSIAGIVGFGGIGKAAAKLLKAFGVSIYAINSSGKTDKDIEFIGTLDDLDYVLKSSDQVILTIPLSDRTRGLIGTRELNLMKPDSILINVARGEIIREKDLYEHLISHPEFYAGIDTWWKEPSRKEKIVTNYPFFNLPNVLGSPHNSGIVPGSLVHAVKYAAENVLRFLKNDKVERIIRG